MDIFFEDPNDTPVPPEKMEIRKLDTQTHGDGRRVRINFEISPFLQRPNIEISVKNQHGQQVSQLSVVEAIENKMEFTLHLREPHPSGEYTLTIEVFYSDLAGLEDEDGPPIKEMLFENKNVVATQQTTFKVPNNL
jgi:hypothetical protein